MNKLWWCKPLDRQQGLRVWRRGGADVKGRREEGSGAETHSRLCLWVPSCCFYDVVDWKRQIKAMTFSNFKGGHTLKRVMSQQLPFWRRPAVKGRSQFLRVPGRVGTCRVYDITSSTLQSPPSPALTQVKRNSSSVCSSARFVPQLRVPPLRALPGSAWVWNHLVPKGNIQNHFKSFLPLS